MFGTLRKSPTTLPRIRCMRCDRPVDRVVFETDDHWHKANVYITAFCHGEREQVVIDLIKVGDEGIKQIQAQEGRAFEKQQLAIPEDAAARTPRQGAPG